MPVQVTLLIENSVQRRGLLAEHGLSYAINFDGRKVLFDTGQTPEVLLNNAFRLNWPLSEVEAVVLSHGHFDHTGGLPAVLEAAPRARVYLHPAALAPKF
ncbi:MAG TPA: MBL fold metallo-hydrolase, partial [Rariglobus sp.]